MGKKVSFYVFNIIFGELQLSYYNEVNYLIILNANQYKYTKYLFNVCQQKKANYNCLITLPPKNDIEKYSAIRKQNSYCTSLNGYWSNGMLFLINHGFS